MKKLTKREKLLIYLLACFLIGFFGIYFVVLPSVQGFQVVNDQAAEAQFTKESMEMAIEAIPTTMQEKAQAQANLTSSKAVYPQQLANEGLDMLLTQLCLDYSLAPKVLSVASNGVGEVLTFVPYTSEDAASAVVGSTGTTSTTTATSSSEDSTTSTTTADSSETTTTETTESSETTEATETTDAGDGTETGAAVQTLIGEVNMEVTGTQANYYRLLDAVAHWHGVWIAEGFAPIRAAWMRVGPEAGAEVTASRAGSRITGRYEGISEEGGLLLAVEGRYVCFRYRAVVHVLMGQRALAVCRQCIVEDRVTLGRVLEARAHLFAEGLE